MSGWEPKSTPITQLGKLQTAIQKNKICQDDNLKNSQHTGWQPINSLHSKFLSENAHLAPISSGRNFKKDFPALPRQFNYTHRECRGLAIKFFFQYIVLYSLSVYYSMFSYVKLPMKGRPSTSFFFLLLKLHIPESCNALIFIRADTTIWPPHVSKLQ